MFKKAVLVIANSVMFFIILSFMAYDPSITGNAVLRDEEGKVPRPVIAAFIFVIATLVLDLYFFILGKQESERKIKWKAHQEMDTIPMKKRP